MILVSIPVNSLGIQFKTRLTKLMRRHTFFYRCSNFVVNQLGIFPSRNIINTEVHNKIKSLEFNFTRICLSPIEKCEHKFRHLDVMSKLLYLNLLVKNEKGQLLVFSPTVTS